MQMTPSKVITALELRAFLRVKIEITFLQSCRTKRQALKPECTRFQEVRLLQTAKSGKTVIPMPVVKPL